MCRLLVLVAEEPVQLSKITTDPSHSIINQAMDSRLRLDGGPINGDGFGIGWYDRLEDEQERNEPCVFQAITPAWSKKVRSPLVFAHVRASTTGTLSEENCHPWSYGVILFQHNGGVADFNEKIKRKLQAALDDVYFAVPQGNTGQFSFRVGLIICADSEWVFALFLQSLHEQGAEPLASSFDYRVLQKAMLRTLARLNEWAQISGVTTPNLLNLCVSDGRSVIATRYISSRHDEAASLYFSTGSSFCEAEPGIFRMQKFDKRESVILIASEPLTFEPNDWQEVENNTMLLITPKRNVLQIPIRDEYFQDTRHSKRSSDFASSKGLFVTKQSATATL